MTKAETLVQQRFFAILSIPKSGLKPGHGNQKSSSFQYILSLAIFLHFAHSLHCRVFTNMYYRLLLH